MQGSSKEDAAFQIDDIGGASIENMIAIPARQGLCSVNLKRVSGTEHGTYGFELESFGEGLETFLEEHKAISFEEEEQLLSR